MANIRMGIIAYLRKQGKRGSNQQILRDFNFLPEAKRNEIKDIVKGGKNANSNEQNSEDQNSSAD